MRIFLTSSDRNNYFSTLKNESQLSWQAIANSLEVKGRQLRSWRSGELSIPKNFCDRVEELYKINLPISAEEKPDYWYIKEAARKGGLRRIAKYGTFGTIESRRRGGLRSIQSPALQATNFKFRKEILKPKPSEKLAELIGIMIGDGGISKFQAIVSLGLKTDREYADFVKSLFFELFNIKATLQERPKNGTVDIVASSISLSEYLKSLGLPVGNKIRQNIDMPNWVKSNPIWIRRCLRGIFDTDGCTYLDQHKYNDRVYKSFNIALTSASPQLLASIYATLLNDGFRPTTTSRSSIRIRNKEDVVRFFKVIGSSNPKHLSRFENLLGLEGYPSGYTGIVSKTIGVVRPT